MKERLDVLMVAQGLATSREKAKALIRAGGVWVAGVKADKAGALFEAAEVTIEVSGEVRDELLPYVSRGGLKLAKALTGFGIDLTDRVCMDVGASTGGFTDCMLQEGARRVYAIDAGTRQLAEQLRGDRRVVVMENTNARYLSPGDLPEQPTFAGVDVSFISLTIILPVVWAILAESGEAVVLVKPQFEAGREHIGKKGVVKDKAVHRTVLEKIIACAKEIGFIVARLDYSPIRGPEGNIEYLLQLKKSDHAGSTIELDPARIVSEAHR